MQSVGFTFWQDGDAWLGYLDNYPDYMTQGTSFDDLKGQALVAFVTVKTGIKADHSLRDEIRAHVAKEIGPVAKPDDIRFAEALPKTRSGKIMRRLLKQVAAGGEIRGDTTTLEDFSVLAKLGAAEE